jgi:hypothetical protein
MNVILKKVPKWGSNFFFTFPTSEGSDLLSSHVMQTPTFISKLSDGNVIFRLDVGKKPLYIWSINTIFWGIWGGTAGL